MNMPMQDDSDLNVPFIARLRNPARDYARAATVFMWLGWIFFAVFFVGAIVSFWVIQLNRPILAVEDGQVVGTVQYDNREIRSPDQIDRDLKQWLVHFVNVDAPTLWEDRAIAGAHLCPQQRAIELEIINRHKAQYDAITSQRIRGAVNFDFEQQTDTHAVELEAYQGEHFRAILRAETVLGLDTPKVDRVQFRVAGRFVQRSTRRPLGLEICEIQRISWSRK